MISGIKRRAFHANTYHQLVKTGFIKGKPAIITGGSRRTVQGMCERWSGEDALCAH